MLKTLVTTLARSNVLVDLAMDVQEQLSRETQAAGVGLTVAGFGAGVLVSSAVAVGVVGLNALDGFGLGVGLGLTIAAVSRVYVARQRLIRLKNLITAQAARDAVGRTAKAGAELVSQGLSSAGETLGRWLRRTPAAGDGKS